MTTTLLDFEVLCYVHANGTLQKYGSLEFERQGCEYRIISPINHKGNSGEKEAYQRLVSKLKKTKAKAIKTKQPTTSDEAFRMVFQMATYPE